MKHGEKYTLGVIVLIIAGSVLFQHLYGPTIPLTDEWYHIEWINIVEVAGLESLGSIREFRYLDHHVIVPFFLYWGIMELCGYNSGILILVLTTPLFITQTILYSQWVGKYDWKIISIFILVLSPARYMEFLWGWQHTITLSITLPVIALAVLDSGNAKGILPKSPIFNLGIGIRQLYHPFLFVPGIILLGTLSSAGGLFGFLAIAGYIFIKNYTLPNKIIGIAFTLASGMATYLWLFAGRDNGEYNFTLKIIPMILCALGGAIIGNPDADYQFNNPLRLAIGAIFCLVMLVMAYRSWKSRSVSEYAFPIALIALGFMLIGVISLSRPYLGNWHLQHILPTICGATIWSISLRKKDQNILSIGSFWTMMILSWMGVIGWYRGFTEWGPDYAAYIAKHEAHMTAYLINPYAKPPTQSGVGIRMQSALMFAAHKHPIYHERISKYYPSEFELLQIYENFEPQGLSYIIKEKIEERKLIWLVVKKSDTPATIIKGKIGDKEILFWNLHRELLLRTDPNGENADYFATMLYPRLLGNTKGKLQFIDVRN
ncbi:MAG: hypothetical protein MI748_02865 [Opitutales bacterium]|nr:hypothetical protein [Opitutales bacterium]